MATLTYLQVHIFYNIPPLILLVLLYRPFSTKGDLRKILFLVTIAVLYTTPWDNYIIWRKAWQYCPTCVMGTIGLVPIEEYIFFVTQTVLTCLIHSLITRCFTGLPAIAVRRHRQLPLMSYVLLTILLCIGIASLHTAWYDLKTFYMRAILLWTLPVLLFLYSITGLMNSYIHYRVISTMVAIAVPSLYLWLVDSIAICAGTWHINERTSLESFIWKGLPLEEAVFFVFTNTMVVLGCTGFDLAFSIVHTYNETLDFSFLSLCRALLQSRDETVVADLAKCVKVLRAGSSNFYTSSFFFNEAVRRDLIVLYAFCRYTDDLTDDTRIRATIRSKRLTKLFRFVENNFSTRSEVSLARRKTEAEISSNCDPIQRSILRFIAHKVPREPMIELLQGYQWDLELDTSRKRRIRFEEDLILYAQHVASSVAEMCMYVVSRDPQASVVLAAREMGVVLQLTNIARDIVTDAVHGRVYVPDAWMEKTQRALLLEVGQLPIEEIMVSPKLDIVQPKVHALRLLDMADTMHKRSTGAIAHLPVDAQCGIRIATDGYFAIGQHLREVCEQSDYPLRARLPTTRKLGIALYHLYKPDRTTSLILGGCVLRIALMAYGSWQDSLGGNVKYTDIDYNVFTDAARYVHLGGSPYERATYRYTPLLAWMLIPNQYFASWGKLLFAGGDILAGWLMIRLLRARLLPVEWSCIWLLNPMVAVISTRGNCEGLLGALAIALLYAVELQHIVLAGFILGLAVHFKIYPIIYAPSILWALKSHPELSTGFVSGLLYFFNSRRLTFALVSLATFCSLSALMYHIYGTDFIRHTFLYHISRSDHRHNFSAYHLFLYLSSAPPVKMQVPHYASLLTFLPQAVLSFLVIPLTLAKRNLTTCFLAQTFAFVTFNKVVTSQYFMWYLVFLPLYLPESTFLSNKGLASLLAWIAGQALWLYFAYQFEMLAMNTFHEMWIATLLFFCINIYILGNIVDVTIDTA